MVIKTKAWHALTRKVKYTIDLISEPVTHHLTHRRIIARFYHLSGNFEGLMKHNNFDRVALDSCGEIAFPGLIERYLSHSKG